jgi:hypothetical protein
VIHCILLKLIVIKTVNDMYPPRKVGTEM